MYIRNDYQNEIIGQNFNVLLRRQRTIDILILHITEHEQCPATQHGLSGKFKKQLDILPMDTTNLLI